MLFGKKPEVLGENADDKIRKRQPLRPPPMAIADIPTHYPSRKSNGRQVVIIFVYLGTLLTFILPLAVFHPFHAWECGLYLFAFTLPLLALAYSPLRRFITRYATPNSDLFKLTAVFLGAIAFIPMGAALAVNGYFDTSVPEIASFTIIGKDWTSHKNGSHYYAYIQSPEPSPLPFAFSNTESLAISRSAYDRLLLNQSTATIHIHKGFLGLPWFDHIKLNGLNH